MIDKYDNLYIGIRALHKELLKPHAERDIKACYYACTMADDTRMREALYVFAGIEFYYCGPARKEKRLVWAKDVEVLDDINNPYALRVMEETICDPDDIDKIQELAFELFLQDKGVLI